MQMNSTQKRLVKESILLMDIMSGQERMLYLERMWNLYFKVYVRNSIRVQRNKRLKTFVTDRKKAYELCAELTKIFRH